MTKLILVLVASIPFISSAQINSGKDLIKIASDLIDLLLPIAVLIALLFFLWGIVVFITKAGDEKAREDGRKRIFWGLIALFVIVSIWGIVQFFQNEIFGTTTFLPIQVQ